MYPFEVWDERTQRIEFYFDRWEEFRDELFRQYPVQLDHERVEFNLYFESDRLEDVWVHNWNPHHEIGNTHLSVYDCFYDSDNWSTIFEVYPAHDHSQSMTWRIIAEKGHRNPWGEPIRIMSTSSNINDNASHRFAYFREKYWKILGWHVHRDVPNPDFIALFRQARPVTVPLMTMRPLAMHPLTMRRWQLPFPSEIQQANFGQKVNWIEEGF